MNRKCIISTLLLTLPFCNLSFADDGVNTDSEQPNVEVPTEDQNKEPAVKYVGQASQESARAAASKRWQNIGIAIGVVAIAITTVILVAKNHKHH